MIEIAVAISAATTSFKTLKAAMEMGKDAQDVAQYFGSWFDAKEKISEANMYAKNPSLASKMFAGKSVEAQALEVTAAKHKVEQMEKELKEFLIWSGQDQFYNDMMIERRKIRERRLREAKKRAEQKKLWTDIIIIGTMIAGSIVFVFGMLAIYINR